MFNIFTKSKSLVIANVAVILLTFILLMSTLGYTLKPIYEASQPLNDNWIMSIEGIASVSTVSLPATIPDNPINNDIIIERTLPSEFFMGATMLFRTSQQFISVYLDDALIYEYNADHLKFGKSPGSAWHFVRLPSDYPNKTLTAKFSSPYSIYSTRINDIYFGTKASHVFSIFNRYGLNTMIGVVMMLIGTIALVSYLIVTKLSFSNISVFFLSMFSIATGFWTICENRIIQLFFNNPFFIYMLGLVCFASIPIYLNLFIIFNYKPISRKLFKANTIISIILVITLILLQVLDIMDMIEFLPVFHIWYVIMIINMTLVYKREIKNNPNIKLFYIALFVLFLTSLIDLMVFYGTKNGVSGYFTQIGLLAFVFIITLSVGRYFVGLMNDKAMNDALAILAFTDALTGLKNRTAFEKNLSEIEIDYSDNYNPLYDLSIVICDINNLKLINDTFGHKEGDTIISGVADIIRSTFDDFGDVFRIGGDEFAILIHDCDTSMYKDAVIKMNKMIDAYNLGSNKAPLSIAYGIATFDISTDKNTSSLFARADSQMYRQKETQKKSKSPINETSTPQGR